MYGRSQTPHCSHSYHPTRNAGPGNAPPAPTQPIQPTRNAGQQRPTARRHRIHICGYDRENTTFDVCRCASPERHIGAYSFAENGKSTDDMQYRDRNGTIFTGDEDMHRFLDLLRTDRASNEDFRRLRALRAQLYDAETIRNMEEMDRNRKYLHERGMLSRCVPHDAMWYAPPNPKGCRVARAPDDPDALFVGVKGAYRPAQDRANRLGLTWGESQIRRL
jgi:hypothetical protein